MSHIEGDGIIEDLFYLLWRKDSPFNEKLKLRIPDTVMFRHGRPMAWYFTNNDGVVLRKKQASLTYPEIQKKFTRGAHEGDIIAYFINIDHDKKTSRLLKSGEDEEKEETLQHKIDYFGLKDFLETFSDYKNFENKTGILQKFIHPYNSNNELIQAVWSPRVCVFTKRVNLRRLNETRFDVYERALTFDGPDFYSKNVPLRGGYIPGKLRSTCDLIVRHIAYISYEKVSIKRLVGYFKVDRDENVWFLWTSSIRINETSKIHKKFSKFLDKPLSLETCMQTNEMIRHIKTNFATKPVSLRMDDACTICHKKLAGTSLISVTYGLLLTNDHLIKKYEDKSNPLPKTFYSTGESNASKTLIEVNKGSIGVPAFIKKLHPGMTTKEYLAQKEKEHFLIQTTDVCEECYLQVSVEHEHGYPYKLTEPAKRPMTATAASSKKFLNISFPANKTQPALPTDVKSIDEESHSDDSNDDEVIEDDIKGARITFSSVGVRRPLTTEGSLTGGKSRKVKPLAFVPENFSRPQTTKASNTPFEGANATAKSVKSGFLNQFMQTEAFIKATKPTNHGNLESDTEETKGESTTQGDLSTLKRDLVKALGGDFENIMKLRPIQSAKPEGELNTTYSSNLPNKKPVRPQTSIIKKASKGSISTYNKPPSIRETIESYASNKYKLIDPTDIFRDSVSNFSGYDSVAEKQRTITNSNNENISTTRDKPHTRHPYLIHNNPTAVLQKHFDQDMNNIMEEDHKPLFRVQSTTNKLSIGWQPTFPHSTKNTTSSSFNNRKQNNRSQDYDYVAVYAGIPKGQYRGNSVKSNNRVKFAKTRGSDDDDVERELEAQIETLTQQYTTKPSSRIDT